MNLPPAAAPDFSTDLLQPPLLAATDFSPAADLAIRRTAQLAAQHAWPLHLAHAIAPGFFDDLQRLLSPDAPLVSSALVGKTMAELQTLAADPQRTQGVDADCHVLIGKPVDVLLRHAADLAAALIAVGSRGETSLRHLTVGSTAARLLRKTRLPVLVVKEAASAPYRHVLVATDFSPAALAALRLARTIAPQARFTLLHVLELPFEGKMQYAGVNADVIQQYRFQAQNKGMQQLRELAEREGFAPECSELLALHGNAAGLIHELEESRRCDLIVMGRRGSQLVEELLLGSTTRYVVDESRGDVLVAV